MRKFQAPTKFPFDALMGSLRYLTDATRPDIAYAVHELNTKLKQPTELHWMRAKRVLRYLQGTKDLCLEFPVHFTPKFIRAEFGCYITN